MQHTKINCGKPWQFWRDERGAIGGNVPDLIVGIVALYGLEIFMQVATVFLKVFIVSVMTINFAHAYSMNQNGIDPATGNSYVQEASDAFNNLFPVANLGFYDGGQQLNTPPAQNPNITAGELELYIEPDPSQSGYDRLTVDYGLQLPVPIPSFQNGKWETVTPMPVRIFFSIDLYQEW